MPSNPMVRLQRRHMSYGDWLGEWFYGFFMVAVVSGTISGFGDLGLDRA